MTYWGAGWTLHAGYPPTTMCSRNPSAVRVRGFTLIELLTVIAIVGILAAILIPTVARVRESAYSAKTTSNLRQLYTANRLHATEWKGLFVPALAGSLPGNGTTPAQWYGNPNFTVYYGNPLLNGWIEPNAMNQTGSPTAWNNGGVTLGVSLGGSNFFTVTGSSAGRSYSFRENEVDQFFPSMVLFADTPSGSWAVSGRRESPRLYDDALRPTAPFASVAFRYSGRAHAVLASGAVVRLSYDELIPADNTAWRRYWPNPTNGTTGGNNLKAFLPPY